MSHVWNHDAGSALGESVTVTRFAATLAIIVLAVVCLCSPANDVHAAANSVPLPISNGHEDAAAWDILLKMLQAQENLTAFEGRATARVCIGGRNVLTTSVSLMLERPNHVAVRWLGLTIRPKHGLMFVDPEVFVSKDYSLSVHSAPSAQSDRWVISAVSTGQAQPKLQWILHVDPETWLIRRAQVTVCPAAGATTSRGVRVTDMIGAPNVVSDGDTAIIEADYRQAGYRRWEPIRLSAQGRMVLEEFLPAFLVSAVARGARGTDCDAQVVVQLDFGASRAYRE